MNTQESDTDSSLLFLHEIDVEKLARTDHRVELHVDGVQFPVQRKGDTGLWFPNHTIEAPNPCKIVVILKSGHTYFGFSLKKAKSTIEINGQELHERFQGSQPPGFITFETKFKDQNTFVTLKCARPPVASKALETIQLLQAEIQKHRPLQGKANRKHLETVISYAVALSEMNSFAKAAVSIVNVTYKVVLRLSISDD